MIGAARGGGVPILGQHRRLQLCNGLFGSLQPRREHERLLLRMLQARRLALQRLVRAGVLRGGGRCRPLGVSAVLLELSNAALALLHASCVQLGSTLQVSIWRAQGARSPARQCPTWFKTHVLLHTEGVPHCLAVLLEVGNAVLALLHSSCVQLGATLKLHLGTQQESNISNIS